MMTALLHVMVTCLHASSQLILLLVPSQPLSHMFCQSAAALLLLLHIIIIGLDVKPFVSVIWSSAMI